MKILALSPHTDDVEIGCGGVLSRMSIIRPIKVVAFSYAPEGPEYQSGSVAVEFKRSMEILQITDTEVLDYEPRTLPDHRDKILNYLWNLGQTYEPSVVFVPMRGDVHQDHQVVTTEAIRAFKHATIFGYELPWNNPSPTLNTFIHLTEENLLRKEEALRQYKSQEGRVFYSDKYMRNLAHIRGGLCGASYAEAFETIRLNLSHLEGLE